MEHAAACSIVSFIRAICYLGDLKGLTRDVVDVNGTNHEAG